jgi:putative sterol carrier protein
MAETAEFFENLKQQPADKTQGINSSYLFDIEGAGKWKVDVKDGSGVTVTEGDADDAAVTLSASEETFQKIVSGEQNPTSAYMTGKLKIRGDMGAAMKLQKLFS